MFSDSTCDRNFEQYFEKVLENVQEEEDVPCTSVIYIELVIEEVRQEHND